MLSSCLWHKHTLCVGWMGSELYLVVVEWREVELKSVRKDQKDGLIGQSGSTFY